MDEGECEVGHLPRPAIVVIPVQQGAIAMDLNQKSDQSHDHHAAAGVATIWGVLLALVVAVELVSLLMSRSMLAGVLH